MVLSVALFSGACATSTAPQAAVLKVPDNASMAVIEARLADAMGQARVRLGPTDLAKTSAIPVLPASLSPLEGRSTVTPVMFDLMIAGGECLLVRRESGETYRVEGVECVAL